MTVPMARLSCAATPSSTTLSSSSSSSLVLSWTRGTPCRASNGDGSWRSSSSSFLNQSARDMPAST
uniref:Uncharacterized protein n=1 Tax=Zea mays TaxID=4577 RepID=C4J896_MAIZE|nr:unknown [Zea mays]